MDLFIQFWSKMIMALVGLTIGTLDLLGIDTSVLWLDILPVVRIMKATELGAPPEVVDQLLKAPQ